MIYFDNASTTKMDESVAEKMKESFEINFANPSSLHSLGFDVEKRIRKSREDIATSLSVKADNLFFVPSGTIANNAVIRSAILNNKNRLDKVNIVISSIEHASLQQAALNNDIEFRYVKVDKYGFIDENDLLDKVDENTILVSIIHVNNEIGSINNIQKLSRLVKDKNSKVLFHSDGVQAFKKINIELSGIDFYTISSHKINGPKGIAALFIRNPKNFHPSYFGGGQEKGLFSGTENTYAIIGFAQAVKLNNNADEIERLNKLLRDKLSKVEGSRIISPEENVSRYILNVYIEAIGAEILLHYLEMDGIYISTGSACSKGSDSKVLKEIGLSDSEIKGCIRISFDRNTNQNQVEMFLNKLKEKVEMIRGILKR